MHGLAMAIVQGGMSISGFRGMAFGFRCHVHS